MRTRVSMVLIDLHEKRIIFDCKRHLKMEIGRHLAITKTYRTLQFQRDLKTAYCNSLRFFLSLVNFSVS